MIAHFVQNLFQSVVDLVYPPVCPGCFHSLDSPGQIICSDCIKQLIPLQPPFCPRCGYPNQEDPFLSYRPACRECPPEPIGFDVARSALPYDDERVRNLIHALKYACQIPVAVPLGEILREAYTRFYEMEEFHALVPVPLHRRRLRQREFNQSTLLSRAISRTGNIPLRENWIARIRMTNPQVRMNPQEREKNMAGAFRCPPSADVAGRRILLIDDVYTTGSTVNEVSRTLKAAGASYVAVLTLARAINPRS